MKTTAPIVFIGGFGSNTRSMRKATEALRQHFGVDVTPITFRMAMDSIGLARKLNNSIVVTHSAGILAIGSAQPNSIIAFSPPLPRHSASLLIRSAAKFVHLYIRNRRLGDRGAVWTYQWGLTREIFGHLFGNLKFLNRVAKFNTYNFINSRKNTDITLVWNQSDDYFNPYNVIKDTLAAKVHILPGEHDELMVRPDELLGSISKLDY